MSRPTDIPAFIKSLHAAYQARTGYSIRYNLHRERQWWEWCEWAEWTWTEADLARVIGYLRAKINKGDRNDGALKFDNLIGRPDAFEEDLNLAKEAAKGLPQRPRPAPTSHQVKDGLANSQGEAVFVGREAADHFRSLLSNPPPAGS